MENRTFVILAADDEEELLEALQLFLEREHMKLIKAADGPAALRLFEKEQPDLVLLDAKEEVKELMEAYQAEQ